MNHIPEDKLIEFLEGCVEGEQGELYPPVFIIKPTDLQTFLKDNAVELKHDVLYQIYPKDCPYCHREIRTNKKDSHFGEFMEVCYPFKRKRTKK